MRRHTVLIADDDAVSRQLLADILKDQGLAFVFAADGPEGRFTVKKEFRTAIAGFRDIPFEHIGLLPKE